MGLAAPQIGLPLQIIVLEDSPENVSGVAAAELAAQERVPFGLKASALQGGPSKGGKGGRGRRCRAGRAGARALRPQSEGGGPFMALHGGGGFG